ncbi:MAG TPA: YdeI/OmpD-associated family protein [Candidatus Limnocylindria bacterium]
MPITRPDRSQVLVFPHAGALREWLAAHHARDTEAWFGYYRRATGKTSVTYAEAVDQALCFGWIDGITYRVDDEVTANRFTPRRRGSSWSAVNIAKVERLKAEGLMAPAGLKAYDARDRSAEQRDSYEHRPADLPEPMLERLRTNAAASAYWEGQTPAYRRTAAFWVTSARQEATRQRRLDTLMADSAAGRPIKLLSYGRTTGGVEGGR